MRKRVWITAIVVSVVCLMLLLLRRPQRQRTVLPEQGEAPTDQLSPSRAVQLQAVESAKNTSARTLSADLMTEMARRRTLEATNKIQERALARWQAPINFYGKVVDENSNAVAEADITFGWSEFPTEEGARRATTKSDADGLFSLHDKRGPALDVWVNKAGYYAAHGGRMGLSYMDEDFSPDPQNPVVFRLRKKGQGTELITSENGIRLSVAVRVPKNNTPVRVDLLQKDVSATGQVEISQVKPPWREATEWSFRMSIPDGGFVENQDEFQFEAPQANYVPTVEYHFTKNETNWTTHVGKQFYIIFGQPRRYGWFRIDSDIAQETIFLTYAINPSGSRNLEPR